MGLLSSIGKAIKKVVKGVGKVFKKAGKLVKKVLSSKAFKVISVVAAVFTAGVSLYAGVSGAISGAGAAAGKGLASQFVAGAKGFITGAAKGLGQSKQIMGKLAGGDVAGASEALSGVGQVSDVAQAGSGLAAGIPTGTAEGLQQGAFSLGGTPVTEAATAVPGLVESQTQAGFGGGLFDKAMGAAGNAFSFAQKNPLLTKIGADTLAGYAQGRSLEAQQNAKKEAEDAHRATWDNIDIDPSYSGGSSIFEQGQKYGYKPAAG